MSDAADAVNNDYAPDDPRDEHECPGCILFSAEVERLSLLQEKVDKRHLLVNPLRGLLHRHPILEKRLGLGSAHVIVDAADYALVTQRNSR